MNSVIRSIRSYAVSCDIMMSFFALIHSFGTSQLTQLTCAELIVIRITETEDGERTMLKRVLGSRLALDEPHEPTGILRRIAVAGGGRDDDDAVLAVRCVSRRWLFPRRKALLLELVELDTEDRIEGWGGLELAGNVLGDVLGVAGRAAVEDEERGHRCVGQEFSKNE